MGNRCRLWTALCHASSRRFGYPDYVRTTLPLFRLPRCLEELPLWCKTTSSLAKVKNDLENKGYTVVPDVLDPADCDKYIADYKSWVDKFTDDPPHWRRSLIQQYRVAHCDPTWRVRLAAKSVFERIWNTRKLFCSMDGIAIGEPPELGRTAYYKDGDNWFHIDQGSWRDGLHVFQGAVYLEGTSEDDHCFRVMEGSCRFHKEFFDTFPKAKEEAAGTDFYILHDEHKEFYRQMGCKEKRVPVPKGGIVLWDSRTVHDNAGPKKGRENQDRWRYVVFVCMAPAIWASQQEVDLKIKAYNKMVATAHWPSQGVWLFPGTADCTLTKDKAQMEIIDELPEIAKSVDVKQMVGIEKYDFEDGEPNDPGWQPKWNTDRFSTVKTSPYFS
ncbi:hypothetical protein FSP39_012787 [Pinctada imbricata]|uniref:Phytanoyl-CoA dioxygenase n=1 Tax=Pinctada imbricata TaxID=66713 RepID=A0AA89CCQ3_PINIB|nr:hypothetical protein FSP39_012787 [Pinctada imbricata]